MALALKRQRVPASRGLEATQLSKVAKIWAKTPYLIWDNFLSYFNAFFHFEKNWQFFSSNWQNQNKCCWEPLSFDGKICDFFITVKMTWISWFLMHFFKVPKIGNVLVKLTQSEQRLLETVTIWQKKSWIFFDVKMTFKIVILIRKRNIFALKECGWMAVVIQWQESNAVKESFLESLVAFRAQTVTFAVFAG